MIRRFNGLTRFGMALTLSVSLFSIVCAQEDRRPLDHQDYDRWNTITGTSLSEDGSWVIYTVLDGKEKRTLVIRNLDSRKEYTIENAMGPRMTFDAQHVAYRIMPDKELVKKLKKEKKAKSELPQEKFELLNLETGDQTTMENVQSFAMPEENGDWIAILLKAEKKESNIKEQQSKLIEKFNVTPEGLERPSKKSKSKKKKKTETQKESTGAAGKEKTETKKEGAGKKQEKAAGKEKSKKEKSAGSTLILKQLSTGLEQRYPNVVSYQFDEDGKHFAFATSTESEPEQDGVWWVDLSTSKPQQIASGLGHYRNLVFQVDGPMLAFQSDRDDYESEKSSWGLFLYRLGDPKAKRIAYQGEKGVPEGWWVSSTTAPYFSENGKHLFYYTAPKPADADEEKDDKDEEPKAKLDIWHWQDPLLQPQQLLQAEGERRRSYIAAYNLKTKKRVQLANLEMPNVAIDPESESELTLGISNRPYRKLISWDAPGYQDVYLVNLRTGQSDLLLKRLRSRPLLSPGGKFMLWWDTESRSWFSKSTQGDSEQVNLTEKIPHPLWNELHDTPSEPRAYGLAGWTEGDKTALIYDRYDIWQLDLTGAEDPVCITGGQGRENLIRFRNQRLDREDRYVDPNNLMLSAVDETSKSSGYYRLAENDASEEDADDDKDDNQSAASPEKILMLPESLGGFIKAEESDRVLFTRSTFRRFPDLWVTDLNLSLIHI